MGLQDRYGRGEDEFDEVEIDPSRRRRRFILLLVLALFSVSSTIAASITLNKGKITEFGQGIYQVKACDQFITIYLAGSVAAYNSNGLYGTGTTGYSNVGTISIDGLDPVACKGNTIRIKLFQSGNSSPLQLYSSDFRTAANDSSTTYACSAPTTSCGYASLVLVVNPTPQADPSNDLSLLDNNGANVGFHDAARLQSLAYDPAIGEWTVNYKYPWAAWNKVSNVTVETASS